MRTVPHVELTTVYGERVRYRDVWQRQHLLLALLGGADPAAAREYVNEPERHRSELTARNTRLVITADPVPGCPSPAVVIADRWGEVNHLATADASLRDLPRPHVLREWLQYVQSRCPECEGEWR